MDSGMPVELLLKYLKEYKVTCDFNETDFEQDLSAMYTEIRRCLVIDYFDEVGPKSPTKPEKPLNETNSEEYQNYKETHFKPHSSVPGLHVKASFFSLRVGGAPHLPGVPHLHVNRP